MTKHYCDICEECHDRLYAIDIYVHIKSPNPGYSEVRSGQFHPTSGVTWKTECCIVCYNKVMFPTWERIQELKIEHE